MNRIFQSNLANVQANVGPSNTERTTHNNPVVLPKFEESQLETLKNAEGVIRRSAILAKKSASALKEKDEELKKCVEEMTEMKEEIENLQKTLEEEVDSSQKESRETKKTVLELSEKVTKMAELLVKKDEKIRDLEMKMATKRDKEDQVEESFDDSKRNTFLFLGIIGFQLFCILLLVSNLYSL